MDAKSMNRPKLLITGASGFTGQHACRHFLKAGFEITAAVRNNSLPNKDIHHIKYCDLTNKAEVTDLIKTAQPEYILHLAGHNHAGLSWIDPVASLEANTMSTAYLIEAARKENPSCKILVVGSTLQYNPSNISTLSHPYSLSKTLQILIAQGWAALYKMHIVIAKPANLIGPGLSNGVCSIFGKKIAQMENNLAERVLEVNNPKARRDFIDVRDAVNAYETLLLHGESGETYEITSGIIRSLEEIIEGFTSMTAVDFTVISTGNTSNENMLETVPEKLISLGWKPAISIESSLKDILDFYRTRKE